MNNNQLSILQTNPYEVQLMLETLKTGKASGPDTINNYILKNCAHELSPPLAELFNASLRSATVPILWKEANVTPVYKKDDPSDCRNYRPISLLSTVGKVLEKIVHKHVFNFLNANNLISSLQSGFVPGDSTVNQLVDIYNTFCKALDDGLEVRAVFCDVSKAFDRVWHKGLLLKLRSVGITGKLLDWFSNYLSDRKQRVVLPKDKSEWISISAGVPQGSILGPLLFLVYINDIVLDIDSTIRLFADDTSLYMIVDNPLHTAITLNQDLAKISTWADKWLVTFNTQKTESLLISRKINKPIHPPIVMNNDHITEVDNHKHLGVVFENTCTWHLHINMIISKAWQRIYTMRKLKFLLDRQSLQAIYISFIRPILEYADVVWTNCTKYEEDELEKIQIEAARIVIGSTKLVSISNLYEETGWETLSARRKQHRLTLFYKMIYNLTPPYLSSFVPPLVGDISRYNLRNSDQFQTLECKSQLYYNSFLPAVVREWNSLNESCRSSPSVDCFKNKLKQSTNVPKYYYSGSRKGQILHTRLRTNSSSLNHHLFSKNITDNDTCLCGHVEDTSHFLFDCPRFVNQRQVMMNRLLPISNPTLDLLLFGDSTLSYQ
ncbi:MAG: reverse transcriptase family protein, partial [Candidatus Thiodiazotropha endolucinida]